MTLKNNTAQNRFEIEVEGHVVFSNYRREGNALALTHVETPVELRGRGAAGQLMQEIADMARAEGLKIRPVCPYADVWLERHKEYADLIVSL